MVAAAVSGLSEQDLRVIREAVAAGRRPRVVFTEAAGQMAGQLGQVVRLTDPAESEDWLVVRFGRDELPFSPGDLRVAPRGAGRRVPVAPPEPPTPAEPEFVIDKPVRSSPAPQAPVPAPVVPAARKGAGKAARPKAPAGLTVTLAYAEGEWTVAAQQGAKALARPYVVRPAEALRMVALVDVPGVREAVEQILAAERAEAERQALRLREQLAEVEARLAELRDAG
ncbi:hypothetical protein EV385_6218 [Krasilnikovia cinnamomea]|uniref:Uncharacterized protein n=1 Tax=Krasilnikovia cinnamomea TaxID=349313 RepID=A0A4Q7ZSU1_9ACTN|nr:hypothetical protein [Krasilnikovia cinnamomea]RZU54270.1 hypothetical protein EV385_6218 [Krasilnikovia cinnamomea]